MRSKHLVCFFIQTFKSKDVKTTRKTAKIVLFTIFNFQIAVRTHSNIHIYKYSCIDNFLLVANVSVNTMKISKKSHNGDKHTFLRIVNALILATKSYLSNGVLLLHNNKIFPATCTIMILTIKRSTLKGQSDSPRINAEMSYALHTLVSCKLR